MSNYAVHLKNTNDLLEKKVERLEKDLLEEAAAAEERGRRRGLEEAANECRKFLVGATTINGSTMATVLEQIFRERARQP